MPHNCEVLHSLLTHWSLSQGEEGRNLYVVVSGNPIVTVAGKDGQSTVERSLNPGNLFGEVALLADCPRTASVRAGATKARPRPRCVQNGRVKTQATSPRIGYWPRRPTQHFWCLFLLSVPLTPAGCVLGIGSHYLPSSAK